VIDSAAGLTTGAEKIPLGLSIRNEADFGKLSIKTMMTRAMLSPIGKSEEIHRKSEMARRKLKSDLILLAE